MYPGNLLKNIFVVGEINIHIITSFILLLIQLRLQVLVHGRKQLQAQAELTQVCSIQHHFVQPMKIIVSQTLTDIWTLLTNYLSWV